ncbi:protein of unknown function DUF4833 [Phytophthora cactorum]|nr:protein of unknown function DUF4833 [Phytophthora cactorum]
MDAILARVSDATHRAHCSNAVHDELQQAEKRLQKALAALRRALQVAEASRELHKSPLALVDESPNASGSMLSRVVSSCNEVGPITRKLHQAVSAPAAENDDANSSATEDEEICRYTRSSTSTMNAVNQPQNRCHRAGKPSTRKRKAPEHYLAPLALPPVKKLTGRELLEKRLALAPQGEFGEMVHSCLLAARDSLFSTSVSKLQSTCRELADAKDEVVYHANFPRQQNYAHIAANFETPAEEVVIIQERLKKMLKEVRGWCRDDPYSVGWSQDRRYDTIQSQLSKMKSQERRRSVASSSMSGEHHAKHYFTEEFPDNDYQCTTESSHPQTPLWPAYLPVNQDRVVVFERSKNAQLVVYSASFRDKKRRELDPKWPLDINWQSFGWTAHPTSNSTGMIERRLAWGYSHKAVKPEDPVAVEAVGTSYTVTLNALPSRPSLLYVDAKGRVILQTTINGVPSRLWKIYVKTNNSIGFIPKVLYVDLHGTHIGDDHGTYERITISS